MPAEKKLLIHGHFYQPPREDPWLGSVQPEGSAAPFENWNRRICRESYAPLAWARILDERGRIAKIVNCYEYLSFNFGPTLLAWLEQGDPETYARVLEGDRLSARRLGHGNAMAQVYHHVIMPLASERDKKVQVAWAVQDFEARFGRFPEGMWLPETAADLPTLSALAEAGIAFTVLAPSQAEAVEGAGGNWREVDEQSLDISSPYQVELPGGRSIAVFFYNGAISQAVAFERLLESGEAFLDRLTGAAHPGLLSLATDGETYGHHFTFGEMALAYVLDRLKVDGVQISNYAAYLAENPPEHSVRIREPSAWSCVHGVERWRSDCGCSTGAHPDWNQKWRGPLRLSLDQCRRKIDEHYYRAAGPLMEAPEAALADYGKVRAGSLARGEFAALHFHSLEEKENTTAWKLLAMQFFSQASLASCAWFFDDLDRLEPEAAMRFALRAMDLATETGLPGLEAEFRDSLGRARSNRQEGLSGEQLFETHALSSRETPGSLVAQALIAADRRETRQCFREDWPHFCISGEIETAEDGLLAGKAEIRDKVSGENETVAWKMTAGRTPLEAKILARRGSLPKKPAPEEWLEVSKLNWRKRQALALILAEKHEERLWSAQLRSARALAPLFMPPAESQTEQNAAPTFARFWPALAYIYASGETAGLPGEEFMVDFLSSCDPGLSEKECLSRRVEAMLLAGLRAGDPDFRAAAGVLERLKDAGLPLDLWTFQNALYTLGNIEFHDDVFKEAGFAFEKGKRLAANPG